MRKYASILLTSLITVSYGGHVSITQHLSKDECAKLADHLKCQMAGSGCWYDEKGERHEVRSSGVTSYTVGSGDLKIVECAD